MKWQPAATREINSICSCALEKAVHLVMLASRACRASTTRFVERRFMPKKRRRIQFIVVVANFRLSQFGRCATTFVTPMTTGTRRGSFQLRHIAFLRPILVPENNG